MLENKHRGLAGTAPYTAHFSRAGRQAPDTAATATGTATATATAAPCRTGVPMKGLRLTGRWISKGDHNAPFTTRGDGVQRTHLNPLTTATIIRAKRVSN